MNIFTKHLRDSDSGWPASYRGSRYTTPVICFAAAGVLLSSLPVRAQQMKPETEEHVKHAAVMVFTAVSKREQGDTPMGSGSGFFINQSGLAITNNHVVDPTHMKSPAEKQNFHYTQGKLAWTVITDSGTENEKTWNAKVLYQNETADQALLQVYDEDDEKLRWPHFLKLLPESRLSKRMKVWALGFPGGDNQKSSSKDEKHPEVSVTTGNVLDLPRTPGGRIRMVYTDVIARPGNSGGPMVDQDGSLVGTVTLMTKPEGREDTGGANYSALVPAKLTSEMVRNALILGKISGGSDLTPFAAALVNDEGRIFVPVYERKPEYDLLYYDDGDQIFGRITTDPIVWDSVLGKLEIPAAAVAYVMTDQDRSTLFIEGGNQIAAATGDMSFQFEPEGGQVGEQAFADIGVVGFRMPQERMAPATGEAIVFDTDTSHLVLNNIQGSAKFRSRAGVIEIPVEKILRFDAESSGKQVIRLQDDRRLTGTFEESPINAVIAATNTPIRFDLSEVERATFEEVMLNRSGVAGLNLPAVLAGASPDILRIARVLVSNDPSGVRDDLDRLMDPARLRELADADKDQIYLLDAVAKLRAGEAKPASKAFRKCAKASDENIAAYAEACAAVLKHYNDFTFEGKPLSDRATFVAAGTAMGEDNIREVRDLLKDARNSTEHTRAVYRKGLSTIRKKETAMLASAIFVGAEADDELIRLWKYGRDLCAQEVSRLNEALGIDERDGRRGRRSGGKSNKNLAQRERDSLSEEKEEAEKAWETFMISLYEYGFRIEDPDIQERREKRDQDDSTEEP